MTAGIIYSGPRSADSLGSASTAPRKYGPARNPVPASFTIPCDRGQWTETTIEALRTLWDMGYATNSIAQYIGFTKNAAIGKAHRLDLPARPSPIIRDGREPKDGRTHVPRTPRDTLPPLPSVATEPHGIVVPLAIPRSAIAAPRPSRAMTSVVSVPRRGLFESRSDLFGVTGKNEQRLVAGLKWDDRFMDAQDPNALVRVKVEPRPKFVGRVTNCLWPFGDPGTPSFRFCDAPHRNSGSYCDEHHKIAYVNLRDRRAQPEAAD